MTSLADFRVDLREDYLKDPNAKIRNNSMVDRSLNKWYQQVQKDLTYGERDEMDNQTYSTVAGTQRYSLPDDFQRVRLVRYNGQKCRPKDLIELQKENTNLNATGAPYWYYIYGDNMGFYPIPNTTGAIDLEYFKTLPTLTDSQWSELPTDFDDAIMAYAAMRLMRGNGKREMVTSFREQYEDQLNTLRLKYLYDDQNMQFGYQVANARSWPRVWDWNGRGWDQWW